MTAEGGGGRVRGSAAHLHAPARLICPAPPCRYPMTLASAERRRAFGRSARGRHAARAARGAARTGQLGRPQGRREVGAVRLRLLVVAAFVAMAVVPAFFAYTTGVLPGPTQASAESPHATAGAAHRRGRSPGRRSPRARGDGHRCALGAARSRPRRPRPLVLRRAHQVTDRVLGRPAIRKSAGFPSASGDVIA